MRSTTAERKIQGADGDGKREKMGWTTGSCLLCSSDLLWLSCLALLCRAVAQRKLRRTSPSLRPPVRTEKRLFAFKRLGCCLLACIASERAFEQLLFDVPGLTHLVPETPAATVWVRACVRKRRSSPAFVL